MSAGNVFGVLQKGIKFDNSRFSKDISLFHSGTGEGEITGVGKSNKKQKKEKKVDDALDFFGFNQKDSPKKLKGKKKLEKLDSSLGGKQRKKEGKMERRKRKLSADAEELGAVIEESRANSSRLLVPSKKLESEKSEEEEEKNQSADSDSDSERSGSGSDEDCDEDRGEDSHMSVFRQGRKMANGSVSSSLKSPHKKEQIKQEEVAHFRRAMKIHVHGSCVPDPIGQFDEIKAIRYHSSVNKGLQTGVLRNIERSEYKEPTAIQMQSLPSILAGRDTLGIAPTGSGKTAAFAIPMLLRLNEPSKDGIRAVVLAPTRELAKQIQSEFDRLSGHKFRTCLLTKATEATVVGDVKTDILIATPLRLVHMIQTKKESHIDLSRVEILCLDEADRLFDMGFIEQVDEIFNACKNKKVQRLMFSATMLQGVEEMANSVLRDSVRIEIGVKNSGASTIKQQLVFVGREEGKIVALNQLIQKGLKPPVLVFVQNKDRAKDLWKEIMYDGLNAEAIHADRTKDQRDETIKRFRCGETWMLICTDLMSRGIDFKAVNMVINYDFPQSAVDYIHRIGRTGRAEREGEAVTFFTENDMNYLRSIANVMKLSGCDVPQWMLQLKKPSKRTKKKLLRAPPKRHRIGTVSSYDLKKSRNRRSKIQFLAKSKKQAATETNQ